jgi:hypothetical protein
VPFCTPLLAMGATPVLGALALEALVHRAAAWHRLRVAAVGQYRRVEGGEYGLGIGYRDPEGGHDAT